MELVHRRFLLHRTFLACHLQGHVCRLLHRRDPACHVFGVSSSSATRIRRVSSEAASEAKRTGPSRSPFATDTSYISIYGQVLTSAASSFFHQIEACPTLLISKPIAMAKMIAVISTSFEGFVPRVTRPPQARSVSYRPYISRPFVP